MVVVLLLVVLSLSVVYIGMRRVAQCGRLFIYIYIKVYPTGIK